MANYANGGTFHGKWAEPERCWRVYSGETLMDILAESPPTTRFSSLSESSSDGLADTDACLVIAAAPFVEFYIAR
jgi:hypothetical protein